MPLIDEEVTQAYRKDKLWKQDNFYYAFLEGLLEDLFWLYLGDKQTQVQQALIWKNKRNHHIITKSFQEDGAVITVERETSWQKLKRRLSIRPTSQKPKDI